MQQSAITEINILFAFIVIMVFSLAVVTFIMVYVIPQFVQIYNTAGAEVAGITLMVLNISEFLKANLLTLLGVLIAVILGITFAYRNVKAFRKAMQIFLMKMPIIGNFLWTESQPKKNCIIQRNIPDIIMAGMTQKTSRSNKTNRQAATWFIFSQKIF